MPIHSCTLPGGGSGYQWGQHGKCYAERSGAERQAEAAHANGFHGDNSPAAAGVLMHRMGHVYLAQRRDNGHWAFPGGMVEPGESPRDAAARELHEETGVELPSEALNFLHTRVRDAAPDAVDFTTYAAAMPDSMPNPSLCDEHTAGGWFPVDGLPSPLHDGVGDCIDRLMGTGYAGDCMAIDRMTVRNTDVDGRMHIEVSPISKANVCPYYGKEIPGWQALGLEPDRIYKLYRDPVELAKAAPTFNRIPLLNKHVPHMAANPPKDNVVGTTGDNARFDPPYLLNSLSVWDNSAIAGIETNEQRELSSSYRYRADMTPGVSPEGEPFDGSMRDIVGNHVALVPVGRAGSDVSVGDSLPLELSHMKKSVQLATKVAIGTFLRPALATDSAPIPFDQLIKPGMAADAIAAATAKHYHGRFDVDKSKLASLITRAQDEAEEMDKAEDAEEEEERKRKEEEEKRAKDRKRARDTGAGGPEKRGEDESEEEKKEREEKRAAEDAALRASVAADFQALRAAEKDVHPLVGELPAMDSAEAVYRAALDMIKVDHKGVHASALPALVRMAKDSAVARTTQGQKAPAMAADASAVSEFYQKYPNAVAPGRG